MAGKQNKYLQIFTVLDKFNVLQNTESRFKINAVHQKQQEINRKHFLSLCSSVPPSTPKTPAPTRVSFQGWCLMGMWGICFSRTRRRLRNPTLRLLREPTTLLKQETFSSSRKRERSETHACQMGEHMYKLCLIRSFNSVGCSPLTVTPFSLQLHVKSFCGRLKQLLWCHFGEMKVDLKVKKGGRHTESWMTYLFTPLQV